MTAPLVESPLKSSRATVDAQPQLGAERGITLTGVTQVRGACPHDCPDTCALITTVKNGIAIRVQGNPAHAQTAGVLCTKVSRYTERTHHAERILQPLKRVGPKGAGSFEAVSWDTALNDIANRLTAVAAKNPEAILPYSFAGTMGLVQGESMDRRLFHRMGASLLDRTICASAGAEALSHTLGGKVGMRIENFADAALILIWGSNSIGSNLHFWRHVQQARRRGARVVCVDPRRTETAEKCDEHLALMPGTDTALAFALMHELIRHDWLDHDYLERYTAGWSALRSRALEWAPERASAVCGVPVEQIRALAHAYGTTKPAAIRLGYGMQRVRGGGNAVRAIACLPALVGAWRHPAGGLLMSSSSFFPVQRSSLQRPDLLGGRKPRLLNMASLGDILLAQESLAFGPRVDALIVYNSNPAAIAPDSGKVAQGLMREDLFTVVLEHFHTDTADHADYVLPATTQLEHWDVHMTYGHTDVVLNQPAIAPQGQARSNAAIFRALAQGMGFIEPCFQDEDEALCRQAFAPEDVDFEVLLHDGFAPLRLPQAPFAEGTFPTASGRCEFVSPRLVAHGLDGLPDHLPNYEVAGSDARYPLAMISPPARNFLNTTFVNVESLAQMEREPLLEIHPDDASSRGIEPGDQVQVFNDRGAYHCAVRITLRARPGVVNGLGIWWRKDGLHRTNVNELTSQRLTDMGGGPTFYDCLVQVTKMTPGTTSLWTASKT
jgi:anaerobic selenocysteine-containing dehydrogenase